MSDNVVEFTGVTKLDIPPERIIAAAAKADLESVVILGYCKDGEVYLSSSMADGGDVLWLFEIAKKALLEAVE